MLIPISPTKIFDSHFAVRCCNMCVHVFPNVICPTMLSFFSISAERRWGPLWRKPAQLRPRSPRELRCPKPNGICVCKHPCDIPTTFVSCSTMYLVFFLWLGRVFFPVPVLDLLFFLFQGWALIPNCWSGWQSYFVSLTIRAPNMQMFSSSTWGELFSLFFNTFVSVSRYFLYTSHDSFVLICFYLPFVELTRKNLVYDALSLR